MKFRRDGYILSLSDMEEDTQIFLRNLNYILSPLQFSLFPFNKIKAEHLTCFYLYKKFLIIYERFKKIKKSKRRTYFKTLIQAFFEVFYLYLIHKNYNINRDELYKISRHLMRDGQGSIPENLKLIKLNKDEVEDFINSQKSVSQRKKGEDSCLFYTSKMGKEFFDIIWNFIDLRFFPALFQKFAVQRNQFIELINQGDEKGKIALFHLGLLGAYERGEF